MAIALLANCDIAGKDITADALLTQRALATYIVAQQADYHFTVKGNQPTLQRDIALLFERRQAPDFVETHASRSRPHRDAAHLVQFSTQCLSRLSPRRPGISDRTRNPDQEDGRTAMRDRSGHDEP